MKKTIFFAFIIAVLVLFSAVVSAAPMEQNSQINIEVSNANGAYLSETGTYYADISGDGQSPVHITADTGNPLGNVISTESLTGTFYISYAGDRGFSDDNVLLLAVKNPVPENITVRIKSSGYRWPEMTGNETLPDGENLTYTEGLIDEIFYSEDFRYGPQNWKPAGIPDCPLYSGTDLVNESDTFSLMFVDLKAGALNKAENLADTSSLDNNGLVRVDYTIENPGEFAVFHAYGVENNSESGIQITRTNDVSGDSANLLQVIVSAPESKDEEELRIEINPQSVQLNVSETFAFTAAAYDLSNNEVPGVIFNWNIDNETVGTIADDGIFAALATGNTTVTAQNGSYSTNAEIIVADNITTEESESNNEPVEVQPTAEPESPPMMMFSAPAPQGGVIPDTNNVFLKVANDFGARFNDFGDHTYNIRWTGDASEWPGLDGGQNALHITNDLSKPEGQITNTADLSGSFWVSDTGGRQYKDEILLLVSVNGSIPDDFKVHLKADGYVWEPNPIPHQPPELGTEHYEPITLDEWFTKDDLIYGPQTWRPAAHAKYPIYPMQNVNDESNLFMMMLVDLNAGDRYGFNPVKVQYEIQNLNSMLAFNAYAYSKNADTGVYNITCWTNRLCSLSNDPSDTNGFSGYYVTGTPLPPAGRVEIEPENPSVPVNGKIRLTATAYDESNNIITSAPFTWESGDTSIGTFDANGFFIPKAIGNTEIIASTNGASKNTTITVTAEVPITIETIIITPDNVVIYEDDLQNTSFTANGYDQFGDLIDPLVFAWTSSNTSVGEINQEGLFEGKSTGNTTIWVESGTIKANAEVKIKSRPDWSLNLTGTKNIAFKRLDFISLSLTDPSSYTDNSENLWEGVNLTRILGLVDDDDPDSFNETLAKRNYKVFITGKSAGNSKTVEIQSKYSFTESDESYIIACKLNGKELPQELIFGRTYWPLKFTGSGVVTTGLNIEEITDIEIEFPPDVRKINVLPETLKLFETEEPVQFSATALNASDAVIPFIEFNWTSSDTSVGTINETGYFEITGAGTTLVTAEFNGVTGSAPVEIYSNGLPQKKWIVDQTGNGDFRTISEAVNCARDRDEIIVRDGTYDENFVIKSAISLKSENGPGSTVIQHDSSSGDLIRVNSGDVLISGFNISYTGFGSTNDKVAIRINSVKNTNISGNTFSDGYYPVYGISADNAIVSENHFDCSGNTAIYLTNSDNVIIKDNTIEKISDGIHLVTGTGNLIENNSLHIEGTGIYINSQDYARIISNDIPQCSTGIKPLFCQNTVISNNQFGAVSLKYGLYLEYSKNMTISDNSFGYSTAYTLLLRYTQEDLKFVNNEVEKGNSATIRFYKINLPGTFDIYMNNFSDCTAGSYGFFKDVSFSLNSTVPVTYIYNDTKYTRYIGNRYDSYAGTDSDGDGLGDTPFSVNGVNHYNPLISPIENYLILEAQSINLTQESATVEVGETLNFSAEAIDQRGDIMPDAGFVWSASPAERGTISQSGLFEAKSTGTVTITVSRDMSQASTIITVTPATKKTEETSFAVSNVSLASGEGNKQKALINTSSAEVDGNKIKMRQTGFNLTFVAEEENPVDDGQNISATIKEIILETDEIAAELPRPGNVSGRINLNLNDLPPGATIRTTISQNVNEEAQTAFQLVANQSGVKIDSVAFTMNIVKTNLENGVDIKSASIRMAVSPSWVKANGGISKIRIIRSAEDGTKEMLKTRYEGTDENGMMIFIGDSPRGLSLFGLVAVSTPQSAPGASSGGGGPSNIGVASISGINAGESVSFELDKSPVYEIDVSAASEIPKLMLTAEEGIKPPKADDPKGTIYRFIEIKSYSAPKDSIKMATIKFTVDKEWLSSNGIDTYTVKLLKYDTENEDWKELSTVYDDSEKTTEKFFADTNNFRFFAIIGEKNSAIKQTTDDKNVVEKPMDNTEQKTGTESDSGKDTTSHSGSIPQIALVIALIAVICTAAGIYWLKTTKENKPKQ
ncbi:PGF-pre-PGF domain-containing protein [Methanoplanus sp. FWC-SCC4]|uniref:PGF-pre-PGF domain-containing protein n=1 Tax=Methanochimaera problematica TaxID=2609417 RepID=A0AA97F9H7_9EURY|nr:Ig-like domain-containing protein [Methanoplanus sp. FWC-SCC4]WOF15325.1 PGF-pre-PGF domain-containing protein [Methanoplanus sp. FWC-SCC4]